MADNPKRGLFITGVDTNVGKTYVTALLARGQLEIGKRVGVYKPVASGCRREGGELVSEDALTLWSAAGRPGTLAQVCPQCFEAPLAPPVAAAAESKLVDRELLRSGLDVWRASSDIVLVEGAGGLMSPIADGDLVADLAIDLKLPLVIVAANRLGVINHVLQTLNVAATYRGGLPVLAVVLSSIDETNDGSQATNRAQILQFQPQVQVVELLHGASELSLDFSQVCHVIS